jgi:phosphotransferase system enzyme I (PtsI)
MSTPALTDVRASLLTYTLDEARRLAGIALAADGAAESRAAVAAAAQTLKEARS